MLRFAECLPVPNERHRNASSNFQSFCVKLHLVEGLNIKTLNDTENFHLEAILYDQVHHQFVGNKWYGATVTVKYEKVPLNQVIYFYTSIDSRELILVVEVVVKLKEWNSDKVLGWSVIALSEVQEFSSSSQKFTQTRVPLYFGSPISLFFMNWTSERQNALETAKSGEIAYTVLSHPTLMRIVHLLPENVLISNAAEIPGLVPALKGGDGLLKPQLQKSATYVLEQVTIRVSPALSSVETDIINKMLEERNSSSTFPLKYSGATITQRRLQVGVHNGLCYVQEPDFYHLLVEPVITASYSKIPPGDKASSSASSPSNFSRNECLTLRSDVKIPYVPCDPNIMFIFIVEYGISFKDSAPSVYLASRLRTSLDKDLEAHQTSSLTKRPTSSVPILWGLSRLSELRGKSKVSIYLTSDPASCPCQTLFMKMSPSQKFELSFYASCLSKKKEDASMTSLHHSAVKEVEQGSYSTVGEEITSENTSPSYPDLRFPQHHASPPKKPPRSFLPINAHSATMQGTSSYTGLEKSLGYEEKSVTLQEITVIPSSLPVIPVTVHSFSGEHNLPRTVYSKIYSAGFPTVFDRNGHAPSVIDTSLPYSVDLNKELTHPPQGNEIVFEFLALSEMIQTEADVPRAVFFTFQFYKFPPIKTEKLVIEPVESDHTSSFPFLLHIMHTMHADEKKRSQPGYMVSYHIDPCDLCPGEYNTFMEFLANSSIHIDMWDGNSLLYLGTAAAPLKFFCRQGKEAVTVTLDLKISTAEYLDDSISQTTSATHIFTGNLHLRFTSIKVPLSPKSLSRLEGMQIEDSVVVQARNESTSGFSKPSSLITRAKPVVETSRELGALLSSRNLHEIGGHLSGSGLTEERRRKFSRMEAVRSISGQNQLTHSVVKDMRNLIKERQRDLMIVESYVEKNKANIIHSFLQKSITSEKNIHPILGSSSFFEFELVNPFPAEQNISISFECPNLSLITNIKEWQFLREEYHMDQKVEKHLISFTEGMPSTVYVKSKEKVCIPFKYQCVPTVDVNSEFWLASSGHNFTAALLSSAPPSEHLSPSSIKVLFSANEQTLTDVLVVTVQPVPPPVTKVFRLLAPEHSLFKKAIRLPCKTKPKHLHIKCTDAEVVYEVLSLPEVTDHIDINLKAPTGSSGTSRTFYIFVYEDVFCLKPSQTLRISIHALQRIDLSCTTGQANRSSVVIRGEFSTRLVQCFSSSTELDLLPSDAFVLSACSVQELSVKAMALLPGIRYFCLTMVDQESQKLLKTWLLVVACPKPTISKAFQVFLAIGKEATKRITFTNNFSHERHYVVHCSHPHLVHMKDKGRQFSVPGKESYALGIYFPPQHSYLSENVYIYINSSDDKNEETYCIKVTCK